MRYKLLGKSGLRVSELCLGTMTFGEDWGWGASPAESRKVYDTFLEAGGNFIDTANVYTNGTSERLLGEFMHGQRERIVLATKYTNAAPGTDPNAAGNHRKSMVQALEGSLKRGAIRTWVTNLVQDIGGARVGLGGAVVTTTTALRIL